jgi:hypothetical protein
VGRLYLLALLGFLSFSCTAANTQISQVSTDLAAPPHAFEMSDPKNFPQTDSMPNLLAPTSKTLVMSLGPKLVELKASYLEKPEQPNASNTTSSPDGNLRRYLSLLATSSFAGSGVTGESELTYSPLNSLPGQCACKEWPKMLRLGLKSRWEGLKYGADYRSTDRGFVSINGVAADQTRDEAQLWGEHRLGLFNIRGSIGESWEKPLDSNGLRITRKATAALKFNRSRWGAQFVSSYEWIEQDAIPNQQTAFTNSLTGSYRPFDVLSVNPSFSIKEERNPYTGVRTETPRTELILAYTPFRDTKLTGTTSFARSLGAEGLNTPRGFGTTATIDWRIGKFLGKEDFLSFNFNYKQQPDFISSATPVNDLSGVLQLRITGF